MSNPVRIILLHGDQGSGKDTIADTLADRYGFTKMAFADRLRAMCEALDPIVAYQVDHQIIAAFSEYRGPVGEATVDRSLPSLKPVRLREAVGKYGWDEAKRRYIEVRRAQTALANDVIQDYVSQRYFADVVAEWIERQPGYYVIPDLRFPHELSVMQYLCASNRYAPPVIWWVKRPGSPIEHVHEKRSESWHPKPGQYAELINDGDLDDLTNLILCLLGEQFGIRAAIHEPDGQTS